MILGEMVDLCNYPAATYGNLFFCAQSISLAKMGCNFRYLRGRKHIVCMLGPSIFFPVHAGLRSAEKEN